MDAHEITPGLWQGSFPPLGNAVRQGGFDLLVLCARELQQPSIDFHNVAVIHAPNDDSEAYGPLTREKLRVAIRAARKVAKAVKRGEQVLVTCALGMNRSGLVSALALHLLYGWPGGQCLKWVRKHRPTKGRCPPLSNPDFIEALLRLSGGSST